MGEGSLSDDGEVTVEHLGKNLVTLAIERGEEEEEQSEDRAGNQISEPRFADGFKPAGGGESGGQVIAGIYAADDTEDYCGEIEFGVEAFDGGESDIGGEIIEGKSGERGSETHCSEEKKLGNCEREAEDFDGEEHTSDGGFENCGDTGPGATSEKHGKHARGKVKPSGKIGSNCRAGICNRAFGAGRAAKSEGERAGDYGGDGEAQGEGSFAGAEVGFDAWSGVFERHSDYFAHEQSAEDYSEDSKADEPDIGVEGREPRGCKA